jgi:RimJ/RimL family protein N-acetyltransferase
VIEPWNVGSITTAERAGYEREDLLRSHQQIGGRRRDMFLYAVTRESSSPRQQHADRRTGTFPAR